MNVLLLRPPQARKSYLDHALLQEPLTHLHLGPVLRQEHAVRLVDLRLTRSLHGALGGFVPDVAVVAVYGRNHGALDRTLSELKRRFPSIGILLVGEAEYGIEHVTERPLDLVHPLAHALAPGYFIAYLREVVPAALAAFDYGFALEKVPGLLVNQGGGTWLRTEHVPHRVGWTGVADRTLLGQSRGRYRFAGLSDTAFAFTTYGCPYRCRFCPMGKQDGSVWVRDRGEVLAELQGMTERNVFLTDYEPLQVPDAMLELADLVERAGIRKNFYLMTRADSALSQPRVLERWKEVGLKWVYLGLDGHTDQRLGEERKAGSVQANEAGLALLDELGLAATVGFVVPPHFSDGEFAELRAYVKHLRPPMFDFSVETPLVGTQFFDDNESKLTTRDWSLYDLHHAVLPTAMPLARFYRHMARLHLLAGSMSIKAMVRSYPAQDAARLWLGGPAALSRVFFGARDHRNARQGRGHEGRVEPSLA